MKKVITYGTYDFLHYGHIRLLERAKALGDYLIVGVTAEDFDKTRGKINVQQSLMERIEAVKATGLADEIIIEEYEGQKIDDICRYDVDIFTVGSDWEGKFDYLREYCQVIYLDRTEGVSSSEIRSKKINVKLGIVGSLPNIKRFIRECRHVNGIEVIGIYSKSLSDWEENLFVTRNYEVLLEKVDAVYIISSPDLHYEHIELALQKRKHVLCEAPITLTKVQNDKLFEVSKQQKCVLMTALKTAYSTAYSRLLLLAKSGKIGKILSIDATATSLRDIDGILWDQIGETWNSICTWGPTALLPIFQLLGTEYEQKTITSKLWNKEKAFDLFSKIEFIYNDAVASVKVGKGVKSEGELVISGTKGYIYVPAPWWKTDYFEIRYENPADNRRYFYQLEGEGIRYEIVAFIKAIETGRQSSYLDKNISDAICEVIEDFYNRKDFVELI